MSRSSIYLMLFLFICGTCLWSCDSTDCQALCAPGPLGNFDENRLNIGINEFAVNDDNEGILLATEMQLLVNDVWENINSNTWKQLDIIDEITGVKVTVDNAEFTILEQSFEFKNDMQLGKGAFLFTIHIEGNDAVFSSQELSVIISSFNPVCDPDC